MKYQVPEIDYIFWRQKNEFYSDNKLSNNISMGLKHASRGGLIDKYTFATCMDLVRLIEDKIKSHNAPNDYLDNEILTIFDLIQGWGGKTGRLPYVPIKNPPRSSRKSEYLTAYREAIEMIYALDEKQYTEEEINDVDHKLQQMPEVGQSYSTKHLCFWSRSLPSCPNLVIFDTRMKQIFYSCNPGVAKKNLNYVEFINAVNAKALLLGLGAYEIEAGLFAFSQNYFFNDKFILKDTHEIKHKDIQVAKSLCSL